jgi:hypothetical protein
LLCEVSNSKAKPNVRARTLTRHFFFDLNPCHTVCADQPREFAVLLICPLPLFACLHRLGMTPVNSLLKVVCTVTGFFKFTLADILNNILTLKVMFTDGIKCKLMQTALLLMQTATLSVSANNILTLKVMFTGGIKCKLMQTALLSVSLYNILTLKVMFTGGIKCKL